MSRTVYAPILGRRITIPGLNASPDTTYFARCGDYVKVGTSSNVPKRLRALSCPSGRAAVICPDDLPMEPMQLLGTTPGTLLHHFPDAQSVGEWFQATPGVLAWIAAHTAEPRRA